MLHPYNPSRKLELIQLFKTNVPKFFDPSEVHDFETYLEDNGSDYFTIEVENKLVGGIGIYINNEEANGGITWIFINPSMSGKGIGKKAVDHCLEILSANHRLKKLVINTSQHAFGFFEKFGFSLVEIKKNYWGKDLDLYKMERKNL